jgi:hypothetical protein
MDSQSLDQANLRRILLFLEEYDQLNASWENAEGFLHYLKRTVRLSFKAINRKYLERLYDTYREQQQAE